MDDSLQSPGQTSGRTPPGFSDPEGLEHPTTIRQPVAWGELDALGHVNHTVYLRWLENLRFAWFERVGISGMVALEEGRVGPILAKATCEYRAPVGFPDTIWTNGWCSRLGRSSLTLHSQVWSEAREAVVAEGEVVLVLFDYENQRSVPIPEAVRAAIRTLDGV
jgi:acyl-CoA thioester hydrolase